MIACFITGAIWASETNSWRWLPVSRPISSPLASRITELRGAERVLELRQVGGDGHHHPEDGRDRGQDAEAAEQREHAQLADAHPAARLVAVPSPSRARGAAAGAGSSRRRRRRCLRAACLRAAGSAVRSESLMRRCGPASSVHPIGRFRRVVTVMAREGGSSGRTRPAERQTLALGRMEDPAPEAARRRRSSPATPSTTCPRARSAERLAERSAAARQARPGPDGAPTCTSATPSSCRSCASSRTSATRSC